MTSVPPGLATALQDRYRIEREVGHGGMATVYLARDLRYDRAVALKVLLPELSQALGAERFAREIEITARLRHPHILPVFDSGETAGQLWYTMPFVNGETLRQRLKREGRLVLEESFRIVREVADALTHAHGQGIVHRDVKPENILLAEGHALLADFGVAKALDLAPDGHLTQSGLIVGTPAYMSPEQGAGGTEVDVRADEYALGAVAYEMLTGELPYLPATLAGSRERRYSDPPRPASALRPDLPFALDGVLERALAPLPRDRFPSLADFATAFQLAQTGPTARSPMRFGGAAAALLLGALGLIVTYFVLQVRPASDGIPAVAVFPFEPATAAAQEWVETIPDLLATSLEGTPGFRVVDPWSLWSHLRERQGDRATSPDPVSAERLARAAQAGWFILGHVTGGHGALRLILRVYRVGSADPARTVASTGVADSLGALVASAAAGVIGALWKDRTPASTRGGDDFTTHSATALKAYLQAREDMRRGLVDSADLAITESLRQDSTFALALLSAIRIRSWAAYMRGRPLRGLVPLIKQAQRFGDSLSERSRLRLQAARASVYTDGRQGLASLRRLLELDSTDFEAWQGLGYNQLVYGWQYGAGAAEARATYEHAVSLDSTFAPTLAARAELAMWFEDAADLRHQEERLRAADTTSPLIRAYLLAVRNIRSVNDSGAPWLARAAHESLPVWITVFRCLRERYPDKAERLIETTRRTGNLQVPPEVLAGAEVGLWVAGGRFGAVERALDRAPLRDLSAVRQRLLLIYPIASLTGVGDTAVTWRAIRALERAVPLDSLAALSSRQPVSVIAWAIAAWHASNGDSAVARQWRHALRAIPPDSENPSEIDALEADLDARMAPPGDVESLVLARKAYALWPFHSNLGLDLHPEAATRFLLALRLQQAGQSDSAAAFFDSFAPPRTWVSTYTPRSLFALGELAEERGDRAGATAYYSHALTFWDRDEVAVAGWRERAKSRLANVSGERPPP